MSLRFLSILGIVLLIFSCTKKEAVYEPTKKENPFETYKEVMKHLKKTTFFASKKFSKAEINFRDASLAAKASIMSAFSLYTINFYDEAINNLNRFLKTYPADKNIIYTLLISSYLF